MKTLPITTDVTITTTNQTANQTLDAHLDSVAIRRIIEEVRLENEAGVSRAYDRVYNRHNR